MRSEGEERIDLGLEHGPSRLQAVARQRVQERSAASRGQNAPDRSASPAPGSAPPGSARPRLVRRASPGSCRAPVPDARRGRPRPRPSLGSSRPGVSRLRKDRGPRACERNSTSTYHRPGYKDAKKHTETQRHTHKQNCGTHEHTESFGNSEVHKDTQRWHEDT